MTLSWNEVVELLEGIVRCDNRTSDDDTVIMWMAIANTQDWTLDEAKAAVVAHFGRSKEYLKPAHVTALIKAARQDRLMKETVAAFSSVPSDTKAIERGVTEVYASQGWAAGERPALRVTCPYCSAGVGERCSRVSARRDGLRVPTTTHPSRLEAAGVAPQGGPQSVGEILDERRRTAPGRDLGDLGGAA